ncbi:hypothetical protein D3C85_1053000 [compost metagenome]
MLVQHVHEGIGVQLLHVEDAFALPRAGQHHGRADHGRNARGVADGLVAGFGIGGFVVADVLDVEGLLNAVLLAGGDGADVRLALGDRTQRRGFRQQGLQELDRDDLAALELHRLDRGHADVFQHFEVLQIAVAEGHPEADAFDFRIELGQRLQFLMVHEVHVLLTHALEIEGLLVAQGRALDPLAVFPVTRVGGHFAQVDFRVEVGGEGQTRVAAVAVQDVERVDPVQQVLLGVGGEDRGHAGVEARAEQRHQAGFLEALLIGPLPLVFELGFVARLIVGRVEVVDAGGQAGVHDGQVLIGQGQVDHEGRLDRLDQGRGRGDVVGVDLGRVDGHAKARLHGFGDGVALGLRAARQGDMREDVRIHRHLVDRDGADAACTDNQHPAHVWLLLKSETALATPPPL